jgi:hypothetical protein
MNDAVSEPQKVVVANNNVSFVEWGPVFAGGILAAAISFVLLTFGTTIGLSFVSPWSNSSFSPKVIASFAAFWSMALQMGSAMIGGYVAGRMRSRMGEIGEHEVEFRDGLHGGLVWGIGVIISVGLFLAAVAGGTQIAGRLTQSNEATNPMAYQADVLLRATNLRSATTGSSQPVAVAEDTLRNEVSRLFARSIAAGGLSAEDRTYLTDLVSQRTGIPQDQAAKRVEDVYAQLSRSAAATADSARRGAVLTGFVTATGLLIAFGAAWWAAQRGGHHRDTAIPARFPLSRRVRISH